MKYLKGSKTEIEDYNKIVKEGENYRETSLKWARIIEINNEFFIELNEKYPSVLEQVDELPTININVSNQNLSAEDLNNFFRSLPPTIDYKVIKITGNQGAGTCNQLIVTTKGYIIIN